MRGGESRVLIGRFDLRKGAGRKFYNTSLIYDSSGALAGTYRKMHIPTIRTITNSITSRRGSGIRAGENRQDHCRSIDLLRPVVPGGGARERYPGCAGDLLSNGHRMVQRTAARRTLLAKRWKMQCGTCFIEWNFRCRGESRRPRGWFAILGGSFIADPLAKCSPVLRIRMKKCS